MRFKSISRFLANSEEMSCVVPNKDFTNTRVLTITIRSLTSVRILTRSDLVLILCTLEKEARDAGMLGMDARDIDVAARGLCDRRFGMTSGFHSSLFCCAFNFAT